MGAGFGEVDIELLGTQEETLPGLIVRDGNCQSREDSPEERMRTAPDQLRSCLALDCKHNIGSYGKVSRIVRAERKWRGQVAHYITFQLRSHDALAEARHDC